MICFPHAKINIGLHIIEKRSDGYHNIETVFYPIWGLYDSLEWIESPTLQFETSGIAIDGNPDQNLCIRAWNILHQKFSIPPIHIFLQKNIPLGAGLGGGSSDAAHLISSLCSHYNLPLELSQQEEIALEIGSDCPFFLHKTAKYAEQRGEVFSDISLDLSPYYIVLANPGVHVSTTLAYSGVSPHVPQVSLQNAVLHEIPEWKNLVHNYFEDSVFKAFPQIAAVKQSMYTAGALYAAMSGSGSTVFGIFAEKPIMQNSLPIIWEGYCGKKLS